MGKFTLDPRIVQQGREAGAAAGDPESLGMGSLTGNPPTGKPGPGLTDVAIRKIAGGPHDAAANRAAAKANVAASGASSSVDTKQTVMYAAAAIVIAWALTRFIQ